MSLIGKMTGKKRLNLAMPDRVLQRLDWLQARTDAASHTEVIRQALFVYEQLVERIADGSRLMEITSKGDLLPLPISIDVRRPYVVSSNGDTSSKDDNPKSRATG